MKFIKRLSNLAIMQDNRGMRAFIEELAQDPATSSAQLKDFCPVAGSENFYLFFSEGEVALIFIDTDGKVDEFACEYGFFDEEATWYTKSGNRPCPFTQLTSLMDKFLTAMSLSEHTEINDFLSVLITNSSIFNFLQYYGVFTKSKGAVFHKVKDMEIPVYDHDGKADVLLKEFRDFFNRSEKLHAPFGNHADFIKDKVKGNIKPATENKRISKKDTKMPAVTILEPIEDPKTLMKEMVGLRELKNNIAEIVAYAKYTKKVRATFPNVSNQSINLHTIIVGNPGTGKTTMCRIYGGLLHSAGILSSGHTVMATRSSFLGVNFGTEEERLRECLKLAQGGCLFIDEAAQLFNNPHPNDPGHNVLQLMLQLLADEGNRDIAVVLALYAKDKSLERLYALDPGIKSRFVNVLMFPDYTLDELIEIARRKALAQGLKFTPKAWHKFCMLIRQIYETRDENFANGREVVNLLQQCVINLALRSEEEGLVGLELLRLILKDIPDLPAPLIPMRKLGFN